MSTLEESFSKAFETVFQRELYTMLGVSSEALEGETKSASTLSVDVLLTQIQDALEKTKPEPLQYAKWIVYNPEGEKLDMVFEIAKAYKLTAIPSSAIPVNEVLIIKDYPYIYHDYPIHGMSK